MRKKIFATAIALAAGIAIGIGAFALASGLDDDEATVAAQDPTAASPPGPPTGDKTEAATAEDNQEPGGSPVGNDAGDPAVDAAGAGEIAVAEVGGSVNRVYKEDDYGARWEVEVGAPEGEFDVYVGADGEVVRVVGPKPGD